ncbi:MAG TPA: hypothetical protein VK487_09505 [Candidatus Bathyarchaeia archaeon]|nr:hypothetical protein [Candidatus Bathyarchaeia archaeon]
MKRWLIVLGRAGTVLLAVGLALLLVSLIPSIAVSVQEAPQIIGSASWQSYSIGTMAPEQTLNISIATNGTIDAYLLETTPTTIYEWIAEQHPELMGFVNVTYFDQFLHANPTLIAWQLAIANETISHEYTPNTVLNVTLAISNHSSNSVNVTYQSSIASSVAPTAEVRTLAEFTIPIGAVFTALWLAEWQRAKRGRRP